MKSKTPNVAFIIVLIYFISICVSLAITFTFVKLIAWCFGLVFSWKIALVIWFVFLMFNLFFRSNKK